MLNLLDGKYGQEIVGGIRAPITFTRTRKHEYLGMLLDYTETGIVKIDMQDYVKKVLLEMPDNMDGTASSPAAAYLFHIQDGIEALEKDKRDFFHATVMQPNNNPASIAATTRLLEAGICNFDVAMGGARLRPLRFDSRKCTEQKRHYHSFVGETACGGWAISKNKTFLWGTFFYWLCHCSAVKEVLKYDGPIRVICCWAQELLRYNFAVIHRPNRMVRDVNALSRHYDILIAHYMGYAATLSAAGRLRRSIAYNPSAFLAHTTKCPASPGSNPSATLSRTHHLCVSFPFVLHHVNFTSCSATFESPASMFPRPLAASAHSAPLFRSFSTSAVRTGSGLNAQPLSNVCSTWLSIGPGIPSIALTIPTLNPVLCVSPIVFVPGPESVPFAKPILPSSVPVVATSLTQFCTQPRSRMQARTSLCRSMYPPLTQNPAPACTVAPAPPTATQLPPIDGVNFTFPASPGAHSICGALSWLLHVLDAVKLLTQTKPLRVFLISIPAAGQDNDSSALKSAAAAFCSNLSWTFACCTINTAIISDLVSTSCWVAIGQRCTITASLNPLLAPAHANPLRAGYGDLVISTRNCCNASLLALPADSLCDHSAQSPPANAPPEQKMPPRPLTLAQHVATLLCLPPTQPCAALPCSSAPFACPLIIAKLRCTPY
jgi:hypothetical protein